MSNINIELVKLTQRKMKNELNYELKTWKIHIEIQRTKLFVEENQILWNSRNY